MKRNLYIIMVCCAAALVSCKKTETDTPTPGTDPEPQPEGKTVLYGSLSEATKTYLHTDDNEKTFKVLWEKDDAIAIIMGGKKTAEYATQGQGVVKAKFELKAGTELKEEDEFEAIYPAGLVKSEIGNALSLVWPAEQEYKVISESKPGEAGNNPMWATAKVAKEDEGVTEMRFYNLGGVVRFKLSQPAEDFNVVMATISADQPLSGAFDLKEITIIEDGKSKSIRKAEINSNGSEDIFIKPTAPVFISSTSGEASFYFAVPEGIYTGVEITLYGNNGKSVRAKLSAGKSLTVPRAEVVRLTAKKVTPSDITEGSNCFIGEGNAPIVITTMGNAFDSKGNALDGNNAEAKWVPLAGRANGCKVVWETVNTSSVPASGTVINTPTYSNGILTVIPTGTPGNALVAVTAGANGTGNILWSYHIWVPETSLGCVSVNGVTFLDRNIGALDVTGDKSLGMQYQWGRKDPLLGFCTIENIGTYMMNGINDVSQSNHQIKEDYIHRLGTSSGSISLSVGSPGLIIHKNQDKWCESYSLYRLWGFGNASSSDGTEEKFNKTIYDPCPSGYRVASVKNFKDAFGTTKIAEDNSMFKISNVLFPPVGKLHHSSKSGETSYYEYSSKGRGVWTAVKRKTGDNSLAWNLSLTSGSAISYGANGEFASECYNVRCVKDKSTSSTGYSFNETGYETINFFD